MHHDLSIANKSLKSFTEFVSQIIFFLFPEKPKPRWNQLFSLLIPLAFGCLALVVLAF